MKKLLPYILILVVMVGFFSPVNNVNAQTAPLGTCQITLVGPPSTRNPDQQLSSDDCARLAGSSAGTISVVWVPPGNNGTGAVVPTTPQTPDSCGVNVICM